ncbi:MAG: hypothetical protein DSY90_03675 [Deltaproteobacteria bacterium]|nr:MAG: hypothetical protein DSY90_03675 [Deltaproteobacteria bacterium]
MTDNEEYLSRPYRMESPDEDTLVEDDNFDRETAYEAWEEESPAGIVGLLRRYWMFLALLILAFLGLILVYNVMRPAKNTVNLSQTKALESRVDELEKRLARFEEKMARRNDTSEPGVQPEVVDRLSDRVGRLESSFKTWMEKVKAKLEVTPPKPAARKITRTTPKKTVVVKKKEKQAPVKIKKAATANTGVQYHTVQPGETLFRISLRYGLPVKQIKKINRLSGNTIKPGQKLQVSP